MEKLVEMGDLGVPPFQETSKMECAPKKGSFSGRNDDSIWGWGGDRSSELWWLWWVVSAVSIPWLDYSLWIIIPKQSWGQPGQPLFNHPQVITTVTISMDSSPTARSSWQYIGFPHWNPRKSLQSCAGHPSAAGENGEFRTFWKGKSLKQNWFASDLLVARGQGKWQPKSQRRCRQMHLFVGSVARAPPLRFGAVSAKGSHAWHAVGATLFLH